MLFLLKLYFMIILEGPPVMDLWHSKLKKKLITPFLHSPRRNSWEGNLELLAVDNLSNNEKKMHHNLMVLRVSWNLKRYKQIQLMTIEMKNLRGSEIV